MSFFGVAKGIGNVLIKQEIVQNIGKNILKSVVQIGRFALFKVV
jgi:hypothetical protein